MRDHWLVRGVCRFLVATAALAALLLALAFEWGDDRTWWIELLRYVPFVAWLVPAVVSVGVSLLLGWRWRVLAAATLGLVLTGVMGLSVGRWLAAPLPEGASVRVMTYNVKSYRAEWQYGAYEALADEITRQAPDVLVMQDAPHLNRATGMHEAMTAALQPHSFRFGFGQYYIASKHPLTGCETAQVQAVGGPLPYVRCTMLVDGRAVTLVTVHTLTPRQGLNATRHEALDGVDDWQENFRIRLDQARQLAREVERMPRPLILAGDFNAPDQSPVMRALTNAGLRDAYASGGLGWGYTIGHALKPHVSFVRIDHILVGGDLGVRKAWTGGRWGSEHRPVVADLYVPH